MQYLRIKWYAHISGGYDTNKGVYTTLMVDILTHMYSVTCMVLYQQLTTNQSSYAMYDSSIIIWYGIIIGGVGGAIAGVAVWLIDFFRELRTEKRHKERIYNWLYEETSKENADKWRSTRAIASYTNLTQDRVRYICSIHEKIVLSTGTREDRWGLKEFCRDQ